MNEQLTNREEEISARRAQRIRQMREEKERQRRRRKQIKRLAPLAAGAVLVFVILFAGVKTVSGISAKKQKNTEKIENTQNTEATGDWEYIDRMEGTGEEGELAAIGGVAVGTINEEENGNSAGSTPRKEYSARETEATRQLGEEIVSSNAILINVGSGEILAQKGAKTKINPASMTKILTVLVAAEHIDREALDDTFTMTLEITDYGYVHDCSSVGFLKDETVTVRDLFYGTILPSGADAAVGLATYVAGSQEAFVEMMNEKLKELGLSDTAHFTNCVGIYDEEHYCTLYDMAIIMEAAADNELCREVLSAHSYTTSATEQHPEGITISNWFLRRIEDKDAGGEVLYAKTGYVVQSGNCAASYAEDASGNGYICVTAGANHVWKCIYDHVDIYKQFLG
ncbi:MAG: D-alanyl-D-alanine carboxypeptidase family protein [Suilimivivens sp.]|nr:D-alanyl-D-alanine carboxypeptidase [Lachnospiraceae bacterium]